MDSDVPKKNFFKYMFNFDGDTKADIMNIVQYALLSILPLLGLIKSLSKFIPSSEESKSSIEIIAEILIQIIVLFIGLFFINRLITFIPTYSGTEYPDFSGLSIVLVTMLILLSVPSKLSDKLDILYERTVEMWDEKKEKKKQKKSSKNNNSQSNSSQSSSQNNNSSSQSQNASQLALSPNYQQGTNINDLPSSTMSSNPPQLVQQQSPDFNKMYTGPNTPLVDAATPGESFQDMGEPMAANSVLGGGFGSSW